MKVDIADLGYGSIKGFLGLIKLHFLTCSF
jgi:hypothetical protein